MLESKPRVLTRVYLGSDPVDFYEGISRVAFDCPACSKRVPRRGLAIKYLRTYFSVLRHFPQAMTGQKWFCPQCGEAEIAQHRQQGYIAF